MIRTRPLEPFEFLLGPSASAIGGGRVVECTRHGVIAVLPRDMPTRVDCPFCAVTR